jgi:outer membrane protein insertion porin family
MRFWLAACRFATTLAAAPAAAQEPTTPEVDSVVVEGNHRLTAAQIIGTSGLVPHRTTSYRDIQRAVTALYKTGQFDDVTVGQRILPDGVVLILQVVERPILQRWSVLGASQISETAVKEKIRLVNGRPLDRAVMARSRGSVDSMYRAQGYYQAKVDPVVLPQPDGQVRVVFQIYEGPRVAISQILVTGNSTFSDDRIVDQMATKPEGFWWFQPGRLDDERLSRDMRERLPAWYGDHGYIDFEVTGDSLQVDSVTGKAALALTVAEGPAYHIGTFDIAGNRRFSREELSSFYPFLNVVDTTSRFRPFFNQGAWDKATEMVRTLYGNNGYIYSRVEPTQTRRIAKDGTPMIDLRWTIVEGPPATINKVEIVGNDVTHERVIREAIVIVPGQLFNRDLLLRSYQNISNIGFFQQPMAPPDVQPTANGVDVNIIFRVQEKRTGNINFGASVGQGTGIGGFLGLQEPNLFGQGKRGSLQWQFGRNINDFTLSYSDPAIRQSRISGTISLYNSRQRYTIGDLGRRKLLGGSLQFGIPLLGARYTKLFASYSLQQITYTGGSIELQRQFQCVDCIRSTVGLSVARDTRIDMPFATGGTLINVATEFNGGPLGGTGDYRKIDVEGRWYTPLGTVGGNGQLGTGIRLVLGLTAKSGFIFGDAGPFYTELYSMGGVQFGIPLRGYSEFSITPDGFNPLANGNNAAGSQSFGESFAAFTVEAGARLSQSLYIDAFLDAGNVYRTASQYDPSRLFKGAGVGAALISPLGPIGLDVAYGFDKVSIFGVPKPGWKLHFRLGNFF